MNSWLWIILLWGCCGRNNNCGNNGSCGGSSNNGCGCDCDSGLIQPRTESECGCETMDMPYETFGCQENGVPCPPPIPAAFRR